MILRHTHEITGSTISDCGHEVVHYHKKKDEFFLFQREGPLFSFYHDGQKLRFWNDHSKWLTYGELFWMLSEQERELGHPIMVDLSALLPPMQGDYI